MRGLQSDGPVGRGGEFRWDGPFMGCRDWRPVGEPLAHRGRVDYLTFNPDGTIVATGSLDGTVRLWDADTGLSLGPPMSHKGAVSRLPSAPMAGGWRRLAPTISSAAARVPAPVVGDVERISCWLRVATGLEFDDGDAIRPMEQLMVWELAGDCKSWVEHLFDDLRRPRVISDEPVTCRRSGRG